MSGPFKMKGHSLPGPNQRVSPVKQPDYKAQGDVIDQDKDKKTKHKDSFKNRIAGITDKQEEQNKITNWHMMEGSARKIYKNKFDDRENAKTKNKKPAVPKYASPAKNKEGKKGKKPEVTVTVTKDGSKMTRSSGGKTYKFTKNPKYNPKAKSRSSDSFSEQWIPEKN